MIRSSLTDCSHFFSAYPRLLLLFLLIALAHTCPFFSSALPRSLSSPSADCLLLPSVLSLALSSQQKHPINMKQSLPSSPLIV